MGRHHRRGREDAAEEVEAEMHMTALERETSTMPGVKTNLCNVESHGINECSDPNWRYLKDDNSWYVFGEGTKVEMKYSYGDGKCIVESEYLGNFSFDTSEFELRYKTLEEKDGSHSYLPYVAYIGDETGASWTSWGAPRPPSGLKVMDYMYAGREDLVMVQNLQLAGPLSSERYNSDLVSAHCAYANCPNLTTIKLQGAASEGDVFQVLPDSLEDTSGMYMNCPQLNSVNFFAAPKNLRSANAMFANCTSITETSLLGGLWHTNSVLLPYGYNPYGLDDDSLLHGVGTTPYLTTEGAQDMYYGVTDVERGEDGELHDRVDDHVIEQQSNIVADEDSTFYDEHPEELAKVDESSLSEVRRFARYQREEEVANGDVKTNMEIRTDGGLTGNVIWNSKSQKYELDETGYVMGDQKKGSNDLWNLIASGGAGLITYGLSGLVTKNKLIRGVLGIGVGWFVMKSGVLRNSLSPLLNGLEKVLPDGHVKDLVHKWSEETDITSHVEEQKAALRSEAIAVDQVGRISDVSGTAVRSASVQTDGIELYMNNNGAMMGAQMCGNGRGACVLSEAAKMGEDCEEFTSTKSASEATMSAMEESWKTRLENGEDPQVVYGDMSSYYQRLFSGMAAYNEGANTTMNRDFADDSTTLVLGQAGLEMTNRATMEPVLDSMYRMNEQYHIFTPEDLAQLDTYPISGIGTVTGYTPGCFDIYRADTASNVYMAQELDMYEVDASTSNEEATEPVVPAIQTNLPENPSTDQSSLDHGKTLDQPVQDSSTEQPVKEDPQTEEPTEEKPTTSGKMRELPDISGILVPRNKTKGYDVSC